VQFANQELFSATNPQTPSLLTVGVPIGLQYGSNSGGIQVQSVSLKVPDGQTLILAGGTVSRSQTFFQKAIANRLISINKCYILLNI
jgi:hypothetical protein